MTAPDATPEAAGGHSAVRHLLPVFLDPAAVEAIWKEFWVPLHAVAARHLVGQLLELGAMVDGEDGQFVIMGGARRCPVDMIEPTVFAPGKMASPSKRRRASTSSASQLMRPCRPPATNRA